MALIRGRYSDLSTRERLFSRGFARESWRICMSSSNKANNCFINFFQNNRKIYFMYSIRYICDPMGSNGLTTSVLFLYTCDAMGNNSGTKNNT